MARKSRKETAVLPAPEIDTTCRAGVYVRLSVEDKHTRTASIETQQLIIARYLEQNPETAKAFLAAVAKGYEYAIENPEEAAEILCEADPTLDSEIVLSSQQWLADQYKAEVDRWGYIDPSRWDAFYQWLWENQLIEEEIPAGFGFSNDYLPE